MALLSFLRKIISECTLACLINSNNSHLLFSKIYLFKYLFILVETGFHVVNNRDYLELLILILLILPPKSWDYMSYQKANLIQLKTECYLVLL